VETKKVAVSYFEKLELFIFFFKVDSGSLKGLKTTKLSFFMRLKVCIDNQV